ncbi:MAG TPA: DUF3052 domain-containing protein, partial [Actinomycetota bacterium]
MPAAEHRDYGGTPLWRKLGIREGARVLVEAAPPAFHDELTAIAPLPAGVRFLSRPGRDLDVVLLFATEAAVLRTRFERLKAALAPAGRLWIAWPKRSARVATDLTFDLVQTTGLTAGLVDNKSAAVTDVFQGLQFVYRVKDRGRPR